MKHSQIPSVLLTLSLVMLVIPPSAQTTELSLEQALELAVENSHQLRRAQAEREASLSSLRAARAARLPTLSTEVASFYIDNVPTLDISLPTGQTFSRPVGVHENYQMDWRLTMPLYTGGRIRGSIDAAAATAAMKDALEQDYLDQLLYQTRLEYLSLCRAERLREAADAALRRATVTSEDVASSFAAGTADSVDLLEADLALAGANLRIRETVTLRRSAEIRLCLLLDLPLTDSLQVTLTLLPPDSVRLQQTLYEIPATNPRQQAAEAALGISRARVHLAVSAYMPTLSVFGGYSNGKPNLDRFHNDFNDYFTVGARIDWSFNLGRRQHHDALRARQQHMAAQQQRHEVSRSIDRQIRLASENLKLAYHTYQTARYSHQVARDNYRLATFKHRQGVLSANRLLQSEASLSEAEASLATALVDYYVSRSGFYLAAGSPKLKEGL